MRTKNLFSKSLNPGLNHISSLLHPNLNTVSVQASSSREIALENSDSKEWKP